MHSNSASQFMDKQIMDLSNSQANATSASSGGDFIDFMNRAPSEKKDDVVPSYDFLPIRPNLGSASGVSNFASRDDDAPAPVRNWNSLDSKSNSNPIRIYSTFDIGDESTNVVSEKHNNPGNESVNAALVSEIDRTMKKYVDEMIHAVDSVSARLSQLETRTRKLENSIDDLKVSVENSHGSADGKMRHLENILGEVQNGVQIIRDKQDILEAHREIAKLPLPKADDQHIESHKPSTLTAAPSPHQQFSPAPAPNAPPPPPPHQNTQPQAPIPAQFPLPQLPSVPQQTPPYFHPPSQIPENPTQQYQIPPPMQQQPPPPQHQYQPPPPPSQYSQPPPSQPHHPPFPSPSLPQPPLSHQPEETPPYPPPPQPYSPTRPRPSSQQYYPPPPNAYEPAPPRPGPGYPGPFGPSSAHGGTYPYNEPSQYVSSGPMKAQQTMGQGGGSGYQQLPTARILPQALPTVSNPGGGSGSPGSGNRVPIEDVVDRVTNMGFPRDHVRATVRKLTESGQSVDLNIVLDKLMNDGDSRGWLGR